jgi:hypothetical protein
VLHFLVVEGEVGGEDLALALARVLLRVGPGFRDLGDLLLVDEDQAALLGVLALLPLRRRLRVALLLGLVEGVLRRVEIPLPRPPEPVERVRRFLAFCTCAVEVEVRSFLNPSNVATPTVLRAV